MVYTTKVIRQNNYGWEWLVGGAWGTVSPIARKKSFSVQFTQSCPTLCSSMDCSMPGFPVQHQLPELTQTHVHRVCDRHPSISSSVGPFSSHLLSFWRRYMWLSGTESPANGDAGSIPWLGRSPGEGTGNPLQYSCLGKSHGQRSLGATNHGVAKSWTQLKRLNNNKYVIWNLSDLKIQTYKNLRIFPTEEVVQTSRVVWAWSVQGKETPFVKSEVTSVNQKLWRLSSLEKTERIGLPERQLQIS